MTASISGTVNVASEFCDKILMQGDEIKITNYLNISHLAYDFFLFDVFDDDY